MPIYEYRCRECGEHFEKRLSLNDEPLKKCEKCGGELEKQWSLSGFQFKGAGWYVTDYAAKTSGKDKKEASDKGQKESGGQSTDTSGAASNTKSEPAPASKNESGSKKE